MAKPIKIVLAVIGILLVLLVGAVLVAATLFDPNDYRGKITEAVRKQTGRELVLGDIKLSVFPWLKVRVADLSFSNAPGFGDTPMASVKEAKVGVQLMPLLLDRQVVVSTVTLDGLKMDLARNADGKTNWDDLVKSGDEPQPAQAPKDGGGFEVQSIDIAGVTLSDAHITYRDAQAGQAYRIENFDLETGALRPGKAADIDASLSAFDETGKRSADLAVSASVLADLVAQKASIDALKLDLSAKAEGMEATMKLAGDVVADLETRLITVDDLGLDFKAAMKDLNADGRLVGKVIADMTRQQVDVEGLKLDFKARTPTLEAKGVLAAKVKALLEAQQYELAGLSLDLDASGKDLPGAKQAVKLSGNASYDAAKGSMRFADGRIAAAGLGITTSITGEGLNGDSPRLSGPVTVAPFNPRALLKALGMEDIKTTDPKALARASLSTQYSGSFTSARLEDLDLKLDDTSITGRLAIKDFATQAMEFALKLDRMDVDRYLAPSEPTAKPAAAGSTQQINATELPIEALEKLNASGTLDAGELKLKGATLKNVRLRIDGPKGSPKLVKLDASTYGGQIASSTRIVPGARPDFALNTSVDAMQLAPMLQNFWGKDIVSGLGNIKLDLTSGGRTVGDLRRDLNGSVSLSFENGAVKGFNLGQIVRRAQALLKGTTLDDTEPRQTDFTKITFAAQIVDGILKSDQLSALSPLFRLGGSGQINLVDETLDYLVSPTVVASSKGQGGKGLEELAGLTIPIRLTGSLYAPKYKLDLQTALKQKAGDELRGKLADKVLGGESGEAVSDAELKQKAAEKLNEEIGRGLDKLFGGKKKKSKDSDAPATETPAAEAPAETTPAPATDEAAPAEPATP